MRSIWKGRMGFGLIGVNVKLYKATEEQDIGLHLMHGECGGGRIKYLYQCQNCASTLTRSELKKGYEVSDGKFVILEEADFDNLPLKSAREISITSFVKDGLDPRIVEDTYYLSPETDKKAKQASQSVRAFWLLHQAMSKLGVRAIGKVAYRDREHPCIIAPFDSIFILQTLCYANEVRDYGELKQTAIDLSEKELELGERLISEMIMEFRHDEFKDEYSEALERLIEAKVAGTEITAPVQSEAPAGDLVAQLLASVGMK